jgi:hypothetical protein
VTLFTLYAVAQQFICFSIQPLTLTAPISRLSTSFPFLFQHPSRALVRSLDCWSLSSPFPPCSLRKRHIHAHIRGYPNPRCDCHHRDANSEYLTSAACFEPIQVSFCCTVATLPESAAQSDHARRTASFPVHNIAHRERDQPALGKCRPQSPWGFCFWLHSSPTVLSRSTTARTHSSSPRCSILSQKVGATTCTYILASPLLGN